MTIYKIGNRAIYFMITPTFGLTYMWHNNGHWVKLGWVWVGYSKGVEG